MSQGFREKPLYVTRPVPPDPIIYQELFGKIIASGIYSNFGSIEQTLSMELRQRWQTQGLLLFNNCTIALLAGLLALPKRGTIITTPFSFPATVHTAKLANFDIKFCDIEPHTLNIDPKCIAEIIDENTVGVLGVHVYGNPCNIKKIHELCTYHGLYEIYDAAHCTDVYVDGKSVFNHGLFSVTSFHATKLFNCGEGGALFTSNHSLFNAVKRMMNFGISKEDVISGIGINGKMSEFNAAIGLSVLPSVLEEIAARAIVAARYVELLKGVKGLSFPAFPENVSRNYQYFPVIFNSDTSFVRDLIQQKLKEKNIHCRKYFFPLISNCPPYNTMCAQTPIAAKVSDQILCLPIHSGVREEDIQCICEEINAATNS